MKRTHVVLDERLFKDIDRLVGTRQRSHFLTQAAEEKLLRIRQLKALEEISPGMRRGVPSAERLRG
jgi:metal-responsive CopG/Arc/MetJ family transcriptional regulator